MVTKKTTTNERTCWTTLAEMVARDVFPARISSLLLWGPPSTGKSSWARFAFGNARCQIVPITGNTDDAALLGAKTIDVHDGATCVVWEDGPAADCARNGKILILDEIEKRSDSLIPILHAITETDPMQIRVRCADGSYLGAAKGFGVIATSNKSPECLSESERTRFLALYVDRPAPGIVSDLGAMGELLVAHFVRSSVAPTAGAPLSARALYQVRALAQSGIDVEDVVTLVFGAHAPKGIADALQIAVR